MPRPHQLRHANEEHVAHKPAPTQPQQTAAVNVGGLTGSSVPSCSSCKLKNQVTETNVPRELKILHVSLIPELLTTFSSIAIVIIDGPCVNARTFNLHSDYFCFDRAKYNFSMQIGAAPRAIACCIQLPESFCHR